MITVVDRQSVASSLQRRLLCLVRAGTVLWCVRRGQDDADEWRDIREEKGWEKENCNEYHFVAIKWMCCVMDRLAYLWILEKQERDPGPSGVTFTAAAAHPVLSHARLGACGWALWVTGHSTATIVVSHSGCWTAIQTAEVQFVLQKEKKKKQNQFDQHLTKLSSWFWAHLVGTIETSGHHFVDDIHQIFRFTYNMIDFDKCRCLSHRRIFHGEL